MRLVRAIAAMTAITSIVVAAPSTAHASSFHVECASSHVSNDDPIVFPGRPGAAHRHEFFGSRSADSHATTSSIRRAATTCSNRRDTASYWVPTLEVGGRLRRGTMTAYYQRAGKRRAAAPPSGLRMIAGDMHAREPQSMHVTSWQCRGSARTPSGRHTRTVPHCRTGQRLAAWLRFQDCWDGRRLDSPDHRSHVAYSRAGRCDAEHPVELMRLVVRVTWGVRPAGSAGVRFGGGMLQATGMHGDFWNAWHMPTLRQLRWDCIEVARPCGDVSD